MRMYMAWEGDCPHEGASLVFANTARDAKSIAQGSSFYSGEWIGLRVRWLKDSPWLWAYQKGDKPQLIDCPEVCNNCELWGGQFYKHGCSLCE